MYVAPSAKGGVKKSVHVCHLIFSVAADPQRLNIESKKQTEKLGIGLVKDSCKYQKQTDPFYKGYVMNATFLVCKHILPQLFGFVKGFLKSFF